MPTPSLIRLALVRSPMSTDEEQLEDLLDEWEEGFETGRDIPAVELCRDCPELVHLLESKIARLRRLNGFLDATQLSAPIGESEHVTPAENIQIESRFTLREFIDGGGLGTVFAGYDELLRREAAIKFLRHPHSQQPDNVKQFKTECEITSRLDHPSIVPIYGHGTLPNGQPYYVMRRISGQTLAERAERLHQRLTATQLSSHHRLDLHALLSVFVTVCRTIHYAHCRGVIHRDIKPANIMIGRHGETTVLDWGLAQMVERDEHHRVPAEETLQVTHNALVENSAIGTPIYMSPEQHEGHTRAGVHSDVYALGATLFVLLGGEAPFDAKTMPELKSKVLRGETVNLAAKYRWLPRSLIAICDKAMSVDPQKRYVTALHLAKDVERYLADEPVEARPDTPIRKAGRWLSRHRYKGFIIATMLLAGVIGSLAYSTVVTQMARREHDALVEANQARVRSLRLAAGFAASSVALEMSDRWRILEIAAHDDKLIELLQNIPEDNAEVNWPAFQGKLMQFKETYHLAAGQPDSWFLCDCRGRQVARVKPSETIGNNFAHRDYFHGRSEDLLVEAKTEVPHITDVHRSKVYLSASTGQLKVALIRPIWSQVEMNPNREFLGILGMSVSLGEFKELERDLAADQLVMVVDTSANSLNDTSIRGLLLHHPQLRSDSAAGPLAADKELLDEMVTIREEARQALQQHSNAGETGMSRVLSSFRDPLGDPDSKHQWSAAFAPVIVKGRPLEIADTGWGVVVAERD